MQVSETHPIALSEAADYGFGDYTASDWIADHCHHCAHCSQPFTSEHDGRFDDRGMFYCDYCLSEGDCAAYFERDD